AGSGGTARKVRQKAWGSALRWSSGLAAAACVAFAFVAMRPQSPEPSTLAAGGLTESTPNEAIVAIAAEPANVPAQSEASAVDTSTYQSVAQVATLLRPAEEKKPATDATFVAGQFVTDHSRLNWMNDV